MNIHHIYELIKAYENIVPLPIDWMLCAIAFGIVAILFTIRKNYRGFIVKSAWSMLAIYVLMLLFGTVLFRETSPEMRYHFEPLKNYTAIYDGFIADVIVNICMFIPLGFLGAITFGHNNLMKVCIVGFLISAIVELAQLLGRCGVCNIDDVIHNSLGCAIGFFIFTLCNKLFHRAYNMHIIDAHTLFAK